MALETVHEPLPAMQAQVAALTTQHGKDHALLMSLMQTVAELTTQVAALVTQHEADHATAGACRELFQALRTDPDSWRVVSTALSQDGISGRNKVREVLNRVSGRPPLIFPQ